MSLKCDIIMDLVALYHDGETSPASTRAIQAHLKECPSCREFYNEYKNISAPAPTRVEQVGMDNYEVLAKRLRLRRMGTFAGVLAYVSASLCAFIILWYRMKRRG